MVGKIFIQFVIVGLFMALAMFSNVGKPRRAPVYYFIMGLLSGLSSLLVMM